MRNLTRISIASVMNELKEGAKSMDDDESDTLVMPVDDFYDMVSRYQKNPDEFEKKLVFDSKSGKSYVASKQPGRYLSMYQYVPVFIDGQYKGIGEFKPDSVIRKIHPGLDHDEYTESDIGMISRISVTGVAKKWKFDGVE